MGSTLSSTTAERQQAIQQLSATFRQPDGTMAFTYNGHVYQTVGTNSDGTLQLLDMYTKQITPSVDPVDVYEAALPPAPAPINTADPIPTTPPPSTFSNVTGQIGTYSSLVNLASQIKPIKALFSNIPFFNVGLGSLTTVLSSISLSQGISDMYKKGVSGGGVLSAAGSVFGVATGVNMLLGPALLSNPAGWLAAGAVMSGSLVYSGINDLITNGFSVGAMATTVVSTIGVAVAATFALYEAGFISLYAGLLPLLTNPIGWAIAGAVVLFSVLWSLFHQPPPEVVAMRDLSKTLSPLVWSAGPILFAAAGATALLMGWPKGTQAPVMAGITVPQSYVTSTLGGAIPSGTAQAPTVLVEHGNGNDPGRVVIVSPNGVDSRGNSMLQLNSYSLSKNLEFVSSATPPQEAYIPFFIYRNGKAVRNPDVVKALQNQDSLLRSIMSGGLDAQEALSAMQLAAATNKYGVTADSSN